MGSVVLDTHAAVWYLLDSERLSARAAQVIDDTASAGDTVYLPSISLVELIYLTEKRRLPLSALHALMQELGAQDSAFRVAPLDIRVVEALFRIPREDVPDMPDRIVAATALSLGLPLVTCDQKLAAAQVQTIC